MRRGRHQEQVLRPLGEPLGHLVTPCLVDLAGGPVAVRRELVSLVEDDDVPLRLLKSGEDVRLDREIDGRDHLIGLDPDVLPKAT